VILPYASGPATQWSLYDYGRKFLNADAAAAGGQAVATVATVPSDELWMVDLVRVKSADTDVTSTAYICRDDPAYDISGTATGAYDVADQASPIHMPAGSTLLIVWKNIPTGLVPSAYVQWTVLKSTSTLGA
jgi:hypothetical protein